MMIKIDVIFNYFIALTIPKLIFLTIKWTSTSKSRNLVSTSLKDASFELGMEEGVGVFVFLGLLFYNISNRLITMCFSSKIRRDRKQNKLLTKQILEQIDSYPISKSLKYKLKSAYIIQYYY
ncbi:hypothetical protein U8527_04910 [Kordia algicida OT-1]|uniref:Uncharacterized protein n=1 Tax=Kordia algicida OT-1 TaxID=391587 RepID=A9DMA3_9FLAO|nr:hypothetical protein [Kordia algicida]EDP97661.1 hypothetical protein KAOT1_20902 [Kordia algicida OT-1]